MEYTFMEPSDFDPEEWRSKPKEERAVKLAELISSDLRRGAIIEDAARKVRDSIDEWLILATRWGINPRHLEEAGAGAGEQVLRNRRVRAMRRVQKLKENE